MASLPTSSTHDVIYSDTDSILVRLHTDDPRDKIGKTVDCKRTRSRSMLRSSIAEGLNTSVDEVVVDVEPDVSQSSTSEPSHVLDFSGVVMADRQSIAALIMELSKFGLYHTITGGKVNLIKPTDDFIVKLTAASGEMTTCMNPHFVNSDLYRMRVRLLHQIADVMIRPDVSAVQPSPLIDPIEVDFTKLVLAYLHMNTHMAIGKHTTESLLGVSDAITKNIDIISFFDIEKETPNEWFSLSQDAYHAIMFDNFFLTRCPRSPDYNTIYIAVESRLYAELDHSLRGANYNVAEIFKTTNYRVYNNVVYFMVNLNLFSAAFIEPFLKIEGNSWSNNRDCWI